MSSFEEMKIASLQDTLIQKDNILIKSQNDFIKILSDHNLRLMILVGFLVLIDIILLIVKAVKG